MATLAYKVVNTDAHENFGQTVLSRLLHTRAPHLGGTNVDVQYDLATLEFKSAEQLEYFQSRILRLQQEINFSR